MDDVRALRRAFPRVEPSVLLHMATAGGAEALGLADLGTIAPGKQAALAYAPAGRVPRDPYAHLVDEPVPVTSAAA
jgi:cytosine/adenosine deaminase-related metal-dependent hydrolase